MTAHDPSLANYSSRVRRWLGLAPAGDGESRDGDQAISLPPHIRLFDRIEAFLDELDLDISGPALAIAHDCVTGANPDLARRIELRRQSLRPVSWSWLERTARETSRDNEAAAAATLIEKLEAGIEEFGKQTRSASEATRNYKQALHRHVGDLERADEAGSVIAELLTISRAMMARTMQIENRLERSEKRTQELQKSLEEARNASERDCLTGLPNRRAFDRIYAEQYRAARAENEMLCIAFCDVDHFKRVNDVHGHPAGDRVLRTVAQMLARISGENCHVARHGGEEFAVLFRGLTLDDAFARLDSARDELAGRRMVNRASDRPFGKVTFSAGIADALAWHDRRAALKAADDALYIAKREGRNRIVIADRGTA